MNDCKFLIAFFGTYLIITGQTSGQSSGIMIHNLHDDIVATAPTKLDAGPTDPKLSINTGNILNAHFYPGLVDYSKGNYKNSLEQMNYFIERPSYTRRNPKHAQFLSIAYYIRGMIYLYHSSGYKRLDFARKNFEQSILLDPKRHLSYIELSHTFSMNRMKKQAIFILQKLLDLKPDEKIARYAKEELNLLYSINSE